MGGVGGKGGGRGVGDERRAERSELKDAQDFPRKMVRNNPIAPRTSFATSDRFRLNEKNCGTGLTQHKQMERAHRVSAYERASRIMALDDASLTMYG